jgi:hypothetical protein
MSSDEFDAFTFNTLRNFEDLVSQNGVEYTVNSLDEQTRELLKAYFQCP